MMIEPDLARADAFARRIDERMSTHVVPFPGGRAYLDDGFPTRHSANFLWVDAAGDAPADHWIAEADRILGGAAGMTHRKVEFADPAVARRLAERFIEQGFRVNREVLMVQRGTPERAHDVSSVEETTFQVVRPLLLEIGAREATIPDPVTARSLVDHRGKLERVVGARFFVARVDGSPASACELFVDGDEAQIESVDTLEEFRGRGLASAVVLRAAVEARDAGARWVFLWADADDWPQRWYARLGFRERARTSDFTRWPPGEGPAAPAAAKSPDA